MGDRGMLTAARIREDLQAVEGLRWITRLGAPTIRNLVNTGAVTPSSFDERTWPRSPARSSPASGSSCVRNPCVRNPLLAAERQRQRLEPLAATDAELAPTHRGRPGARTNRYVARRLSACASGR